MEGDAGEEEESEENGMRRSDVSGYDASSQLGGAVPWCLGALIPR